MTPPLAITVHAARRYHQRVAHGMAEDVAALRLFEAVQQAVDLPLRHVVEDWCAGGKRRARAERQRGSRYVLAGLAVCAVRQDRVITVLRRIDDEDLASLLVWAATGVWP